MFDSENSPYHMFYMILTAEFTNSIDPDEVAHNEPPHQDLHCLSSGLSILNIILLDETVIEIFCRCKILSSAFWNLKS